MKKFELHFDGGCQPNPGQGYGSFELLMEKVVPIPGGKSVGFNLKRERVHFGRMTSNMAEYRAMICGLRTLSFETRHGDLVAMGVHPKNITLSMFSDSKLLVEQMNGRWRCKKPHIQMLIDEARGILLEFGHWKCVWNSRRKNVARFGH